MQRGNVWRRAFVCCCAVITVTALLLSGCGGKAGGEGTRGSSGSDTAQSAGQGSAGNQAQPGSKAGSADSDDDLPDFNWDDWDFDLMSTYDLTSPFNKLSYTLHAVNDEGPHEWTVALEWLATADLAGRQAERLQLRMNGDSEVFNFHHEYWFVDGTLAAFQAYDEDGPTELETDAFFLSFMEMAAVLPLMPFHTARMATEGVDTDTGYEVKVVSQTVSTDTMLGRRVPVAVVKAVSSGPDGEQGEATLRIAQIGGLPFVLESNGVQDGVSSSVTVTPTVIELR